MVIDGFGRDVEVYDMCIDGQIAIRTCDLPGRVFFPPEHEVAGDYSRLPVSGAVIMDGLDGEPP